MSKPCIAEYALVATTSTQPYAILSSVVLPSELWCCPEGPQPGLCTPLTGGIPWILPGVLVHLVALLWTYHALLLHMQVLLLDLVLVLGELFRQ